MARQSLQLLILFIILFGAAGCSQEYQSERHLYRATRLARNILINPEAIPPQEFNRAVKAYELIPERYPDTWSARRADVALGSLYLAKKEYKKAREIFSGVLETYPENRKICLEVQFAIARSYESEGSWDRALPEYKKIIEDYPDADIALSIPMYIAQHYAKEQKIAERDRAYRDAVTHYRKIAEENPDTVLGFRAENFIAMSYVKQGHWGQAVENLERLVMDYPMAKNVGLSMRMIADISVKRLNDPERAIKTFEGFLERHPQHALKDYLTNGLEALKDVSTGE